MKFSRLFPILTFALPLICSVRAEEPRVESLAALCNRLAKETGKSISADRSLAGLPVYVDRRSLSPAETLKAVAFGFHATLSPAPNGWKISRTEEDRKRMLRDTQSLWKARITEWLAEGEQHVKEASQYGNTTEQVRHYREALDEQMKKLREQGPFAPVSLAIDPNELTPIGTLYQSIFKAIGPDRLCNLGPEERRVWTNRSEGTQVECPGGDALLQAFAKADRAYRLATQAPADISAPTKFTFKQIGGVTFDLRVFDTEGHMIGRYGGPPFYFAMAGPILRGPATIAAPFGRDPGAWKAFDADTLATEPYLGIRPLTKYVAKSALPAVVTKPDKVDPLNFAVRLGLGSIAEGIKGKGFVAVANDEMLAQAQECLGDKKMNVVGFDHVLQGKWQYERVIVDGVTVLRSRNPLLAEATTVDRIRLAGQASYLLNRSKIGMRDIASAFYGLFPGESSRVASALFRSIVQSQPHSRSNAFTLSGSQLCWVGAALANSSGGQTRASFDPGNEPFKTLLNRGVNSGWMAFETAVKLPDIQLDPATAVSLFAGNLRLDFEGANLYQICSLGNGGSEGIEAQELDYEPLDRIAGLYAGMSSTLPPNLYKEHPELLPDRQGLIKKIHELGKYHTGNRERLSVLLYVSPTMRSRISMEELTVTAQNLTFDDLPPGVQKDLVDQAMAKLADILKSASGG